MLQIVILLLIVLVIILEAYEHGLPMLEYHPAGNITANCPCNHIRGIPTQGNPLWNNTMVFYNGENAHVTL